MVTSAKKRKRYLVLLNVALGVAIVLSAYCLLIMPVQAGSTNKFTKDVVQTFNDQTEKQSKPISEYKVIYQRHLRKPLFDPKPVIVAKIAPPKPQLNLSLVGTVLEPGFTYAILKNRSGQTKFVNLDETYEGAKVTAIDVNSVTVIFNGETITLEKNKKEGLR